MSPLLRLFSPCNPQLNDKEQPDSGWEAFYDASRQTSSLIS